MATNKLIDPIVERVVEKAWTAAAPGPLAGVGDPVLIAKRVYRFASSADVVDRDPVEVVGIVASLAALAARRETMTSVVRAFNPTAADDGWTCQHTVLQIVAHDMPFLVDSIAAVLNDSRHGVYSIVHPRIVVRRDAQGQLLEVLGVDHSRDSLAGDAVDEAWLHFEIEREPDPAELATITASIEQVLRDVRAVVEDWQRMRVHTLAIADELINDPPTSVPYTECEESAEFLRWLCDDHFTFLGYRDYDLVTDVDGEDALVCKAESGLGLLRTDRPTSTSFSRLPAAVRRKAREPRALVITKANSRSPVHRSVYLDYVGIKQFNRRGEVIGERRLIGLFATTAYAASVTTIPHLRQTVVELLRISGFASGSHSAKDLEQFVETYPRDELFQVSAAQLWPVANKALSIEYRRLTALFLRPDDYGRFVSALVYLPRDKNSPAMRERLGEILAQAYGADRFDVKELLSESVLARLHFVVRLDPGAALPGVDSEALENRIKQATWTWDDELRRIALRELGEAECERLWRRFRGSISEAYREQVDPAMALYDLRQLSQMDSEGESRIELLGQPDSQDYRFVLYHLGEAVMLSELLPIFASLGAQVLAEHPFLMGHQSGAAVRVYHVELRLPLAVMPLAEASAVPAVSASERGVVGGVAASDATDVEGRFAAAFEAGWNGRLEVGSLNQLVLAAGLSWPEVAWVRAWVRYSQQLGTTYSPEFTGAALIENPNIAAMLVRLFRVRLDPDIPIGNPPSPPSPPSSRGEAVAAIHAELIAAIDAVASLGADRVLRRLLTIVMAATRTNAFTSDVTVTTAEPSLVPDLAKTPDLVPDLAPGRDRALAIKFDPLLIPDVPTPVPSFEIWVDSPRVSGTHLRFGKVARGGIRWSDRPEDFRTEILGLAKAQTAKNAVIVPVGAKGGFVVRRPVVTTDRVTRLEQGVGCYREFISALLDVTDNRIVGRIQHPDRVVCWDSDDSYLVVAADKGTATFSDIANEVAAEHGFWLGDAFASGGSTGYDHKRMGITARGVWESVRRHFRESGVDASRDPITVVGIGDMSGDVFGNAMLLSESMRLVAAFDHRHIFIDPDPNPAAAFAERTRLASLRASSWADYQSELLSRGGGVFLRTAKSIRLADSARVVLGIESAGSLTPDELVQAILRAPVDLLLNGGIGTFVKSRTESNFEVGDKGNDTVRIDAGQLRATVVGEGGNLGFTQLGRIEAATNGVAINTDAIDNSAGVSCSDREVNIKIALDAEVGGGKLSLKARNLLLVSVCDQVASLVLRDNYLQNMLLGNARSQADSMFIVHRRMMQAMQRRGALNRKQAQLPTAAECELRASAGRGLTAPELAVLVALVKLDLTRGLLASDLPDEDYSQLSLRDYFPQALVSRVGSRLRQHPLRREIVATQIANEIVDFGGISYMFRACEETGAEPVQVARAYMVVREVFELPRIWSQINELDGAVPVGVQTSLHLVMRRLLDRATRWILSLRGGTVDVAAEIARSAGVVQQLSSNVVDFLAGSDLREFERRVSELTEVGAPVDLAREVAGALYLFSLLDIADISQRYDADSKFVAQLYFTLSAQFDLGELLGRISALPRYDHWSNLARASLRSDLYSVLASLTIKVLRGCDAAGLEDRIEAWSRRNSEGQQRVRTTLEQVRAGGEYDLATLSVILRQLRTLAAQAAGQSQSR